jgi:hypothetical protein|tara:strand:- start:363 stop:662 length:300 start_codon:yes stop_codon:yes gene_type:complete
MKNIMIATSVAVLMSTTAFATDCKYVQKIILDDNNVILSAKTEYICKESKPIIVLPPNTYTEVKKVRPRVVSHTDYVNGNFYNNEKGLDFLVKLIYNSN